MEKPSRMAFVAITFSKESRALFQVISVLSEFEPCMLGSIQVPESNGDNYVYGVLVRANTDQLGALTGKLGKIPSARVKSALMPEDK